MLHTQRIVGTLPVMVLLEIGAYLQGSPLQRLTDNLLFPLLGNHSSSRVLVP